MSLCVGFISFAFVVKMAFNAVVKSWHEYVATRNKEEDKIVSRLRGS
jgi:hypothetical protein